VAVLSYPTTMRTLLARAGAEFAELEIGLGKIDFWDLGARLAADGRLAPLAVGGRIERVGSASILYTTETSHARAGGPVLAMDGTVVAVSTATASYPDTSAPGIPIALAVELIQRQAGSRFSAIPGLAGPAARRTVRLATALRPRQR